MKVRAAAILSGILLLGLIGCSGTGAARPQASDSRASLTEVLTAMLAHCPGPVNASSPEQGVREQLFVEAAILQAPSRVAAEASLTNLQGLAQTAQVELVAVPHIIADFDHRAEMAWGSSDPTHQELSVIRWSVLPRRADNAKVLDVEMDIDPPMPQQARVGPPRTVSFSTTVREDEPVLARVEWDAASHRSLMILFRTFEIHGEQDLRAIFECKMQQRAAALRRAGSASP